MVVNDTKNYKKMKNKSLFSIEKNIAKWEKTSYYHYKKLFSIRKSTSISKRNNLENSFDENRLKLSVRMFLEEAILKN